MLGVQNHRPRQLHLGADGTNSAAVQTDLPRRRRKTVPGADQDDPPLDPPANREGKVQTVREGKSFLPLLTVLSFAFRYAVTHFIMNRILPSCDSGTSCLAVCALAVRLTSL